MKNVISSVFLGALLTIGGAAIAAGTEADPIIGTWKLNAAKSTFAGIPAYKSQIRTYSQSARGITLKMTTVSAEGKETTTQATYQLDGKDFSSMGTTGRGKGVPRRHRAERAAALAHVAQNTYRTGEITLGVMPLYHTMGVRSLLAMAAINGVFVCLPRFDAGRALALIAAERISTLYLVPTLYHDLLNHCHFKDTVIGSVRKLGFAGAAMTDGLLQRLDAAFRPELFVNHYGSSEIYTFTIEQQAAAKPGSAGKAGLNTEVRIVRIGSSGSR